MNTADMSQDDYEDLVAQETGTPNKLFIVESKDRDGIWVPVLGIRASLTENAARGLLESYLDKKKRQSKSGKAENRYNYQITPYRQGLPITPPAPNTGEAQTDEMRAPEDSPVPATPTAPTSKPNDEMRASAVTDEPAAPPEG